MICVLNDITLLPQFTDVKYVTDEGIALHQYNHSSFNQHSGFPSSNGSRENVQGTAQKHEILHRVPMLFRVEKTRFIYCNKSSLIYRLSNHKNKCRVRHVGSNISHNFKTKPSINNIQEATEPRHCIKHNIERDSDKANFSSTWLSHPRLPRIITKTEYDSFMALVSDVSRLFESANITLVMSGGTLLGSYMFHDMIPWDDDIDLWMPYRDVPKVKRLFRNETLRQVLQICSWGPLSASDEYKFETLSQIPNEGPVELYYRVRQNDTDTVSKHFFKLFYTKSSSMTNNECKWPFIDVAVYDEDSEQVKFREQKLLFPTNVFYPLIKRPLGPNMLLAPRDTRAVLQAQFHHFICVSTAWSHRLEVRACHRITTKCNMLWNHYPQVWSTPTNYGLLEELILGNETLNTFQYRNKEYVSHRPHDLWRIGQGCPPQFFRFVSASFSPFNAMNLGIILEWDNELWNARKYEIKCDFGGVCLQGNKTVEVSR